MSDFSNTLGVTASGLQAQAARLRHLSENIANADTPGYRRKTVAFEPKDMGVKLGRVSLDPIKGVEHFDPSHPLANASGYYEGSNVNLIIEIADAREAQRSYEANLKIFDQTRQMSSALLELLRR
ncbi:MAG: flagellar basal body rod protein FlgC [Cognatishimia sp.]